MKRAVLVDGPDLATAADVRGFLATLGVPPEGLRVDVFREATFLRSRIRIVDDSGQAPFLDDVPEGACIPVIRADQLAERIARSAS